MPQFVLPHLSEPLDNLCVYVYYDGPQLYSCWMRQYRRLFLVICGSVQLCSPPRSVGQMVDQETWILAPVTHANLKKLECNQVDLHDLFSHPEDGQLLQIQLQYRDGRLVEQQSWQSVESCLSMLPVPGVFLKPSHNKAATGT